MKSVACFGGAWLVKYLTPFSSVQAYISALAVEIAAAANPKADSIITTIFNRFIGASSRDPFATLHA
jgi:hypothetical protein